MFITHIPSNEQLVVMSFCSATIEVSCLVKSHGCKQETVRKRKRASALVQSTKRAHRNDAIPNKKKL